MSATEIVRLGHPGDEQRVNMGDTVVDRAQGAYTGMDPNDAANAVFGFYEESNPAVKREVRTQALREVKGWIETEREESKHEFYAEDIYAKLIKAIDGNREQGPLSVNSRIGDYHHPQPPYQAKTVGPI